MSERVLFLYTELAGYTVACLQQLSRSAAVHVFRYPVNAEAPFQLDLGGFMRLYNRQDYTSAGLLAEVNRIDPDLIVCSGWIDKDYLKVCRAFAGKIPVVLALDNQWKGTLRQHAAAWLAPFTLKRIFSHCWVPGKRQSMFAKKLGFSDDNILLNLYSADTDAFDRVYTSYSETKQNAFPHRFVYAGRYHDFKGVRDLWEAFAQLQGETPNDWELWCLGTGSVQPLKHPAIRHFGFVQPGEMDRYMAQCGIFILPSRKEPWGVAVHEFAAAGFPLLLSDEVGAADAFLENGRNGFLIRAGDKESIKNAMRKIIALPDERIAGMMGLSNQLAKRITPAIWAQTILNVRHVRD